MSNNCNNCRFHELQSIEEPCSTCILESCRPQNYGNPPMRQPAKWQPKDCTNKDCEVKGEDTCPDCEFKQNDQTSKADAGKLRLTLVPRQILYDIAKVREYGCNKYPEGGTENWRKVDAQRYRDAAYRHFVEYLNEPSGVDEESGLYHIAHLACNIAFLCELEHEKLQGAPDNFCGSCKYCDYDWNQEPCFSCSNKDDHWEGK